MPHVRTNIHAYVQTDIKIDKLTLRQIDIKTFRPRDKLTYRRQTNRHSADRQRDRH